jgi:hypothetical protein
MIQRYAAGGVNPASGMNYGAKDPIGYRERSANQNANNNRMAMAAQSALRGASPASFTSPAAAAKKSSPPAPSAPSAPANPQAGSMTSGYGQVNGPWSTGNASGAGTVAQQKLGSSFDGMLKFSLDADLRNDKINAFENFGTAMADIKRGGADINAQYALNFDKMVKAANSALQGVGTSFAGRGLYNGSGRVNTEVNTKNSYDSQFGEMELGKTQAFQQLNAQGAAALNAYKQAIRNAVGNQTQRNSDTARNYK